MKKIIIIMFTIIMFFVTLGLSGETSEKDIKITQKWLKKIGIKYSLQALKEADHFSNWWGEIDEIDTSRWKPKDLRRKLQLYHVQIKYPEDTDIIYIDQPR